MPLIISEHVPEFKPGELAITHVKNRLYSPDGWAMGGWSNITDFDSLIIYEKIDLGNFPSSNDFFGCKSDVGDGEVVIVMKCVGRPYSVKQNSPDSIYDVYEIMLSGVTRHIFRYNIEKLTSKITE